MCNRVTNIVSLRLIGVHNILSIYLIPFMEQRSAIRMEQKSKYHILF